MKSGSVVKLDVGKCLLQCSHLGRDIVFCVRSREQQSWNNRDAFRSGGDIFLDGLTDCGARKLEETVSHSAAVRSCSDQVDEIFKLNDSLRVAAAMSRNDNIVSGKRSHDRPPSDTSHGSS